MAINTFLKINGTPIQKMLKEYKVDYNLLHHNSSRTTETYIHNLQNSLTETYVRLKKIRSLQQLFDLLDTSRSI